MKKNWLLTMPQISRPRCSLFQIKKFKNLKFKKEKDFKYDELKSENVQDMRQEEYEFWVEYESHPERQCNVM